MRIPGLTKAGLAFALGFFIGDALINPLLGQEPTFDWGLFNNPDTRRNGEQEPLPPGFTITQTGEMGSEGAEVFSTNQANKYHGKETTEDDEEQRGCRKQQEEEERVFEQTGDSDSDAGGDCDITQG